MYAEPRSYNYNIFRYIDSWIYCHEITDVCKEHWQQQLKGQTLKQKENELPAILM